MKTNQARNNGSRKTPSRQGQTLSDKLRNGQPPQPSPDHVQEILKLKAIDRLIEDLLNPSMRKAIALLRIFAREHAEIVRDWTSATNEIQKADGLEYLGDQVADELAELIKRLECPLPSTSALNGLAEKAAQ
jgi:hypothetical protein